MGALSLEAGGTPDVVALVPENSSLRTNVAVSSTDWRAP